MKSVNSTEKTLGSQPATKNKAPHKEFRPGNLVEYDRRIFEICTIAEEFPTLNTGEFGIGVVEWNNIKPLRITKQWFNLIGIDGKFGISITSGLFHIVKSDLGYILMMGIMSIREFEYIHELQNIWYWVTEIELEINIQLLPYPGGIESKTQSPKS